MHVWCCPLLSVVVYVEGCLFAENLLHQIGLFDTIAPCDEQTRGHMKL